MKAELCGLLSDYREAKLLADRYKKEADKLASKIKAEMKDEPKCTLDGYAYERKVSYRESVDEDKLLHLVKQNNIPVVKLVEKVDEEALSELIMEGRVGVEIIEQCTTKKEVVALYMKKGEK